MGSVPPPAQIPTSFGHELRACLRCRLVKTFDQFRESGCENCPFLNMDSDRERVADCTTPNFTGYGPKSQLGCSLAENFLSSLNPCCGKFAPGCYTLAVSEELSQDLKNACDDARAVYIPPRRV